MTKQRAFLACVNELLSVLWFVIDNYRRITMKDTIIKLVQGAIMGLGIVAALLFGYHMGGL